MKPCSNCLPLILLAALWGLPDSGLAQTREVTPGDPAVSGHFFEPYASDWRMTLTTPDGTDRPLGRWLDSLDIVTIDGLEYLRRIQTVIEEDGSRGNRQIHLVARPTMAPLRSHLTSGFRVKHVDFGPDSIVGFMSADPEGPFVPLAAERQSAAFDFELAGVLLVAFNLTPGDTVRFPSYSPVPSAMNEPGMPTGLTMTIDSVVATATVTETVLAGSWGPVEATRVSVRQGNRTLTFWLTDTAPYIVRFTAETPRGTTQWELQ